MGLELEASAATPLTFHFLIAVFEQALPSAVLAFRFWFFHAAYFIQIQFRGGLGRNAEPYVVFCR